MSVKILLVDDHLMLSNSLKIVLEKKGFSVSIASSVETAIIYLKSIAFDLVIADIEMPKVTGLELIQGIAQKKIKTLNHLKIIVLTSTKNNTIIKKLHALGINGLLTKNVTKQKLVTTINNVLDGKNYYEIKPIEEKKLTKRELDVLQLILEEKTTSEIAVQLQISTNTVEDYRKKLLRKTNSKNVIGLVKYSFAKNLF